MRPGGRWKIVLPFFALGIISFFFQHNLSVLLPTIKDGIALMEQQIKGVRYSYAKEKVAVGDRPEVKVLEEGQVPTDAQKDVIKFEPPMREVESPSHMEPKEANIIRAVSDVSKKEREKEPEVSPVEVPPSPSPALIKKKEERGSEEVKEPLDASVDKSKENLGVGGGAKEEEIRRQKEKEQLMAEWAQKAALKKARKANQTRELSANMTTPEEAEQEALMNAMARQPPSPLLGPGRKSEEMLSCMAEEMRLTSSQQKVLAELIEAEIESIAEIPKVLSCSMKVKFKGGGMAVWKPFYGVNDNNKMRDQGWAEIAAFHVSSVSGFNLTPVVVGRWIPLAQLGKTSPSCKTYIESISFEGVEARGSDGKRKPSPQPPKKKSSSKPEQEKANSSSTKKKKEDKGDRWVMGAMVEWVPMLEPLFEQREGIKISAHKRQVLLEAKEFFHGIRIANSQEEKKAYKEIFSQTVFDFIIENDDRNTNVYNWYSSCTKRKSLKGRTNLLMHGSRKKEEGKPRETLRDYELSPIWDEDCRVIALDNGLAFRKLGVAQMEGELQRFSTAWGEYPDILSLLSNPRETTSRVSRSLKCDPLHPIFSIRPEEEYLDRLVQNMNTVNRLAKAAKLKEQATPKKKSSNKQT